MNFPTANLQQLFKVGGGSTPSSKVENWGGDVVWVTPSDLRQVQGGVIVNSARTLSQAGLATSSASLYPLGSIVISTRAPIGYVAIAGTPLSTNQGCRTLVPRREIDARYFAYVLASSDEALNARGSGSTFIELSGQALAEFPVPVPPLEVQRRIADHLDTETARIDTLLAKNATTVQLLAERSTAMAEEILGSATRRVPLWLLADLLPGYAYSSDSFQPTGEYRLLRGVNVTPGSLRWDDTVHADEVAVRGTARYQLEPHDVVIGMDRPWIGSGVRVAHLVDDDFDDGPIRLVQRVLRIRVDSSALLPELLVAWMRTRAFYSTFEPDMTGVSVPHVSGDQVGAAMIPVPRQSDQVGINGQIRAAGSAREDVERRLDAQRTLLHERRRALITAAVTGELEI